jgi:mannosyl-oligosaccharide alpha-1,2-mannosidase
MEDKRIVTQILKFAATIDFTTTKDADSSVSLFETNIRYLGGLLAGKQPIALVPRSVC